MTAPTDLAQQTAVFQSLMSELGIIIKDAADEDHAGATLFRKADQGL